jgi:hypothetical protein
MRDTADDPVRSVAADFIILRGRTAFAYLNERAELALDACSDIDSAIAWWEIAITTVELQYRRSS